MNLQIHEHENNPESQSNLEKNKTRFSKQCLLVLELLLQGKRLTTINAPSYGILSLPRRIADLREKNGIYVNERWIKPHNSSVEIKEWFLSPKSQAEKKELQDFLIQYQNEEPEPIVPQPIQTKLHL